MQTNTRYFIRIKGQSGSFCETGYSLFYTRLSMADSGGIEGEVYGPDQARAHIAELREFVYEGKKHYAASVFEIVKEVTTSEVIETLGN